MDATRRRHYLKALGLQPMRLRGASAVAEVFEDEPVPTVPVSRPPLRAASVPPAPVYDEPPPDFPPPFFPDEPPADFFPPPEGEPEAPGRPAIDLAQDLPGLAQQVAACESCKLCATRTQTVFGVGAGQADLMVIGEGPGAEEDARGEPFVGRAGQLLDQMLRTIGRFRAQNTYIANVVKCRPPGNRDPEADEVEACRPWLDQQIRLIKPRLIVGLGRVAAQRLLKSDQPLSRLRGPVHHYGEDRTPVLITYHPAYLLRAPREKSRSWEDLKRIDRLLRSQEG